MLSRNTLYVNYWRDNGRKELLPSRSREIELLVDCVSWVDGRQKTIPCKPARDTILPWQFSTTSSWLSCTRISPPPPLSSPNLNYLCRFRGKLAGVDVEAGKVAKTWVPQELEGDSSPMSVVMFTELGSIAIDKRKRFVVWGWDRWADVYLFSFFVQILATLKEFLCGTFGCRKGSDISSTPIGL